LVASSLLLGIVAPLQHMLCNLLSPSAAALLLGLLVMKAIGAAAKLHPKQSAGHPEVICRL